MFLSIQSIVFTTDIAVDSLSYTYSTSEVFQNVAVVFTFSIVLNFTGPKVPAGTSPHLGFAVYLSDGENITSSLNNGTTLRVDTESVTDGSVKQVEELKGEINDGDVSSRNTVNLALSKPNGGQNPGGQNPGGQDPGENGVLGQNPRVDFQGGGQNPAVIFLVN